MVSAISAQAQIKSTVTVHTDQPGATIDRHLYGQFAEHLGRGIYEGIWVGEGSPIPNTNGYRNDVLAALRRIHVPVIRWPGGCFADEYHWREGIGPRNERPIKVNTHWGGVEEPNTFGTHEFLDFAELIGADAYVSGNAGSGSAQEMADWVEYITAETILRWHSCVARTVVISPGNCRSSAWATKRGAAAATCAPNTGPTNSVAIRRS